MTAKPPGPGLPAVAPGAPAGRTMSPACSIADAADAGRLRLTAGALAARGQGRREHAGQGQAQ